MRTFARTSYMDPTLGQISLLPPWYEGKKKQPKKHPIGFAPPKQKKGKRAP